MYKPKRMPEEQIDRMKGREDTMSMHVLKMGKLDSYIDVDGLLFQARLLDSSTRG